MFNDVKKFAAKLSEKIVAESQQTLQNLHFK